MGSTILVLILGSVIMKRVVSKDGTEISYSVSGRSSDNIKPALILVHGAGGSGTRWASVLPLFNQPFEVYALHRRGRNRDFKARNYSIEIEYQDIAALVDHLHHSGVQTIYLLGHSFGGICCLEASLLTAHIDKLILYEPPVCGLGVQVYPVGFLDKIDAFMKAGDREAIISSFLVDIVRLSPLELELFQSTDQWSEELKTAHTLPRELRAAVRYEFDERRFSSMKTQTLLLCGSDSLPFFKVAANMIEGGLSCSYQQVLSGQQHVAMDTAPELFTRIVIDFLCQSDEYYSPYHAGMSL